MSARRPGPWHLFIGGRVGEDADVRRDPVYIEVKAQDGENFLSTTLGTCHPEFAPRLVEVCNAHDRLTRERDEAVAALNSTDCVSCGGGTEVLHVYCATCDGDREGVIDEAMAVLRAILQDTPHDDTRGGHWSDTCAYCIARALLARVDGAR